MIILTDIHGNFDTMKKLLDMTPQEEKDKGVVICGDLIDRGPKSMEIIQWCMDNKITVVMGNHEKMMIDEAEKVKKFIAKTGLIPTGNAGSLWTVNGGHETLQSYEVILHDVLDDRGIPTRAFDIDTFDEHVEWLKKLPLYIEFPEVKNEDGRYLVISHSVIGNVWKFRSDTSNLKKGWVKQAVLWSRPNKVTDVPEIYNIIGHTPQEYGCRIRNNYANIDTGCFYTTGGFGLLTALQFPEMVIYECENIDTKVGSDGRSGIRTVEDIENRKKNNKRHNLIWSRSKNDYV